MLRIRRATMDDAELLSHLVKPVHDIHVAAYPTIFKPHAVTPEWIADFRDRLLDDSVYVFIGEVDGEPIGYVLAEVSTREDDAYSYARQTMLIDQMSVNPERRSQGYGEALMGAVFDLARSLGIGRVVLTVWAFNERAIDFYERQGFKPRDICMEAILE